MRLNATIAVSGLLALIGAALLKPTQDATKPSYIYSATGYNDIVKDLITHHWLDYNRGTREEGLPLVHLTPEAEETKEIKHEVQSFYRNSYLRSDLDPANTDLWIVSDGQLSIDPHAHDVQLPMSPPPRWLGNIMYHHPGEIRALLSGLTQTTLRPVDRPFEDDADIAWRDIRAGGRPKTGLRLDFYDSGSRHPPVDSPGAPEGQRVARVMLIGNQLYVRAEHTGVQISVDGQRLLNGFQALPPGADLRFDENWGRPVSYFSRGVIGGSGYLSRYEPLVGRLPDQTRPMMEMLSHQFVDAMNGIEREIDQDVETTPKQREQYLNDLNRHDVVTSLDVDFQDKVQGALETFAEAGRGNGNGFPAAITVMDATSGQILGLASYPVSSLQGKGTSEAWKKNWNFRPLLIGSAAKPIFASAILDTWPDLWTLSIPPYPEGKFADLEGFKFSAPCDQKNNDCLDELDSFERFPQVDFNTFIQYSSNKYAASLMLLADSRDPFGEDRTRASTGYHLRGTDRHYFPAFVLGSENRLTTASSHLTWIKELSRLFDVDTESIPSESHNSIYDDDGYDKTVWSALIDKLPDQAALSPADFRAPSPERINLSLNNAMSLRNDYLTVILGGATSRWTNIKLAEAYARIVTGRRLSARLTEEGPEAPSMSLCSREAGDGQFCDLTRQRMLDAMALVSAGGTASSIRGNVGCLADFARRHGQVLGFFSKTGTPEIPDVVYSAEASIAAQFGREKILRVDQRNNRIDLVLGGDRYSIRTNAQMRAALQALRQDHTIFQSLNGNLLLTSKVLQRVKTYNIAHSPAERQGLFSIQDGIVVGVPPRFKEKPYFGKVYVFVVGLYPQRSAKPSDGMDVFASARPLRAFAVAVNLQKKWGARGTNQAVELSKQILDLLKPQLWPGEPASPTNDPQACR